jgi:hypothetical protein
MSAAAQAAESPAARRKVARNPQRSRITNGSALLSGLDQRSAWIRRCRDLIELHESDLGGHDHVSTAEQSLIRRCAVLTTELEIMERKFAAAGQATATDLDLYIRASGNLRRLLESLGLRRRARNVTPPTLEQYLRACATRS